MQIGVQNVQIVQIVQSVERSVVNPRSPLMRDHFAIQIYR